MIRKLLRRWAAEPLLNENRRLRHDIAYLETLVKLRGHALRKVEHVNSVYTSRIGELQQQIKDMKDNGGTP